MTWSWENPADGYMLSTLADPWLLFPMIMALKGVKYVPRAADILLRNNLLIYGVGGIIVPFIGIKAIDMFLVALHLA